jgi:hypothetical protein
VTLSLLGILLCFSWYFGKVNQGGILFVFSTVTLHDPPNLMSSRQKEEKVVHQEAKYVERWPNTTSAWAGWSRFDIPVDRYGGGHSLLHCTSITLVSPTCHQASQQKNTY